MTTKMKLTKMLLLDLRPLMLLPRAAVKMEAGGAAPAAASAAILFLFSFLMSHPSFPLSFDFDFSGFLAAGGTQVDCHPPRI